MMWQTVVDIEKPDFSVDYHSRWMLIGSCFAENMGMKLMENRFAVDCNPCGIVYNPESVAQVLERLMDERVVTPDELIWHEGKWMSWGHHGSFSASEREVCLEKMNARIYRGAEQLRRADVLLITFGTSWVYRHLQSGCVVANCHRFPERDFERFRLSVPEIVGLYERLLGQLERINPGVRVLFTVSPIRHWKDGAHGNQLSKSVLLLAIDELVKRRKRVYYFPSYEIVLDELRDYRFYAEDMLHVSGQAVDYIWSRFRDTFLSADALQVMRQVEKINKGLNHRPSDPESETYIAFRRKLEGELEQLGNKYPLLNRER
ncbi:MAG: GSCFA domain-containing protein [Odoribacter sp.]|nr:GSCFA domain-containing protein [Odoribacter sp.]